MTLVVSEGSSPDGAFFFRDSVNSCWFCAPFYELLSHAPTPNQPKGTLVNWAHYITAEPVVPAARDEMPQAEEVALADAQPKKRYERPWLRQSSAKQNGVQRFHHEAADFRLQMHRPRSLHRYPPRAGRGA
jgi:hypothetical protein